MSLFREKIILSDGFKKKIKFKNMYFHALAKFLNKIKYFKTCLKYKKIFY